jgi:hypothetical protein
MNEISKQGVVPRMHNMMCLELAKQRHEELLREAEMSRQAKALRAAHKGDASRRSTVVWELKRQAQRLLKLLKLFTITG